MPPAAAAPSTGSGHRFSAAPPWASRASTTTDRSLLTNGYIPTFESERAIDDEPVSREGIDGTSLEYQCRIIRCEDDCLLDILIRGVGRAAAGVVGSHKLHDIWWGYLGDTVLATIEDIIERVPPIWVLRIVPTPGGW